MRPLIKIDDSYFDYACFLFKMIENDFNVKSFDSF